MGLKITLPDDDGARQEYALRGEPLAVVKRPPAKSRIALSAAHVVSRPDSAVHPSEGGAIDWEATMAFRRHLLEQGLGVAEAMDTAQRGMGLSYDGARELIERTCAEFGPKPPAPIFAGCGTDHLAAGSAQNVDDVIDAYLLQAEQLQRAGARLILMASAELARVAQGPEDYAKAYAAALAACEQPVILHWLGDMFDPRLAGYWGAAGLDAAAASCLEIIAAHAAKVDGIKISLLDKQREIDFRRRLPDGVRLYTGDDFNYPELIAGDGERHSDALLGIFDPIAPAAAAALAALDDGDEQEFRRLLDPTVALSRLMFEKPTWHYKAGVVFLAWLNGHQRGYAMLGGVEGMRSLRHLAGLFRLADGCGLLADPELAVRRMKLLLETRGFGA
ncbi:MAG: dihydrodipicolinate synthase family protein [Betaproteobacteria bacterium AqS2]|uniref:Dihydrodipicolinate synthase family protein n=1 Tax=Candidatus Amphirhobacter heronislandensis TaxID=1732024 RepID=A0A930UE00_9GAMM|nr:dihydrodipicolinate synthase family protein [Betaproteobacteria bacterium AqS2]